MSNIEWTDLSWNPVVGCTPVSPGCLNCYAAVMARRLEGMGVDGYEPQRVDIHGLPAERLDDPRDHNVRIAEVKAGRAVFTGEVRCLPDRLMEPLHWRKPRRVFVNSMSDLFHESVPFEFIDRVWAVMALCPQHTFQVLTKRPERMAEYLAAFRAHGGVSFYGPPTGREQLTDAQLDRLAKAFQWPLPNVWVGTSVEDQARADLRVPQLLRCPAVVRFLSVEPLLGPVDLVGRGDPSHLPWDWVIVGGESGAHARPCDVGWIRGVVQQCQAAKVPVFVKQLGTSPIGPDPEAHDGARGNAEGRTWSLDLRDRKGGDPAEWPEDLRVREWPRAG